jgi:hypothetical protein
MTSLPVHNYNTNKRLKSTENYKHAICAAWEIIEEKHLQLNWKNEPESGYYTFPISAPPCHSLTGSCNMISHTHGIVVR